VRNLQATNRASAQNTTFPNCADARTGREVSPEDLDLDVDKAALTREYDESKGIADDILGTFDHGGLEDADQDDDEGEGQGLDSNKRQS
jgi:hypothetical protein